MNMSVSTEITPYSLQLNIEQQSRKQKGKKILIWFWTEIAAKFQAYSTLHACMINQPSWENK